MSSRSDEGNPQAGTKAQPEPCRECDSFGEDRCSIHGQHCRSTTKEPGYTRMTSRYSGACRTCRRGFSKGEVIYWAPERKPLCQYCGQGTDPVEAALSAGDCEYMMRLLNSMSAIENLERPWSNAIQDQFETTLGALYGQFRKVARVAVYIERHMDELRMIAARQGLRHSRPLLSKRADVCRICNRRTEKGELIWWSTTEPLMCFDCGRGKDPVEAALHNEDRARLEELLDRARTIEAAGELTAEKKVEYDAILVSLYSKFRRVVKVKRLLVNHIESLKEIALREGPGKKRTVISKSDACCRSCQRTIDKGEVVWWSPDEHRLCFDCGQLEEQDDDAVSDSEEIRRARELLEKLAAFDRQQPENLPSAWAAKFIDEREDVLIELYCNLRHIPEVRAVLYEHFTELCEIASRAG